MLSAQVTSCSHTLSEMLVACGKIILHEILLAMEFPMGANIEGCAYN